MIKKIFFLVCLLMAMVWTAGCHAGERPVAPFPLWWNRPPPPAPRPEVFKPTPVEEPVPSKKLKQRVFY